MGSVMTDNHFLKCSNAVLIYVLVIKKGEMVKKLSEDPESPGMTH